MRIATLTAATLLVFPLMSEPVHAQRLASADATRSVVSDPDTRRRITAHRIGDDAPVIDGRLDEPIWQQGEVATDFVQHGPAPGEPATQRTEARILYDDDALYVAMRMHDTEPHRIVAQLARRDEDPQSDKVFVEISSYNDGRTAFVFSVNAAGAKSDFLISNDDEFDDSWDAVWDAAVSLDDEGWTAEYRIPLSQLRFDARSGGDLVWGINLARSIMRTNELAHWAAIAPDAPGFVSSYGELHGLRGLAEPRALEVQPYVVSRLTSDGAVPADHPFLSRNQAGFELGGDFRYGLTSELTLSGTINPDFGQVEADPSVFNLSTNEVFFSERRPFFVEGSNIFDFSTNGNESVFYSRRIGRSPSGGIPCGGCASDMPDQTTILGAAKLSGKTSDGWSVGLLNAVTAEETGIYRDADGDHEVPVEPMTNYAVGRVLRDFRAGQSAIGGVFTAVNRDLGDDSPLSWLPSAAYVAGLDARHRFSGDYELSASLLGSHVRGTTDAIDRIQTSPVHYFHRPDAAHLEYDSTRTSLSGLAAAVDVGKMSGGHWRWASGVEFRSAGLEINDLGSQTEGDYFRHTAFVGYDQFEPLGIFQRFRINLNAWHVYNTNFDDLERYNLGGNVNGNFRLDNFWGGWGGVGRHTQGLSNQSLRGGPMIVRPARLNAWAGFYTDSRKPLRGEFWVEGSNEDGTDGGSLNIGSWLSARATSRVQLSLSPQINWSTSAWQYLSTITEDTTGSTPGATHYLHGHLAQTTASLTARLSYTFTPDLSLQLYLSPFMTAGDYDRFLDVSDSRASDFDERFIAYAEEVTEIAETDADGATTLRYEVDHDRDGTVDFGFGNRDFNFKDFNANMVLRWEYRPGSALFLVWSSARSDFTREPELDFGRDLDALRGASGRNVFLIKASYWLGL